MRSSGLRVRLAANLAAAVSLCFGLLAFTTLGALRGTLRDVHVTAVAEEADLVASEAARCSTDACLSAIVEDGRRSGLQISFHEESTGGFSPRWIPSSPAGPAHVSVERLAGSRIVEVDRTVTAMAARSQSAVTGLVVSLVLIGIALVVVGTLLFERSIVRRLTRLDEQLGSIERLDLETSLLASAGGDEIGRMSGTLRRVTEKLRDDKRQTQSYIHELQETNATLRQTQEGLARSDRLATVGRLAAGVAHEIGNPVAAILGYVEILRAGKQVPPEYVERIDREARRVDRIVRDLLDFARAQPLTIGPVSVATVVAAAARLVQPQPRWRSMALVLEIPPDLPAVAAHEHYATQVLVNLLINAADAAEGHGRIVVSGHRDDEGVIVRVADDGPGIAPEDVGRIFDPFFTKKAPGQGTGLGLSICHRLMESFGGSISVSAAEPHGAVFTLRFRVYTEPARAAA